MKYYISIIIPIYNVEKYLQRCLNSVLEQKYQDWEAILVDDGSKDDSGKIADEYALRYANIRVIHQNNAGLSVARNEGLNQSTGKYVMFLDSDDYLIEDRLNEIVQEIEDGLDVLYYDINRIYNGNSTRFSKLNVANCGISSGLSYLEAELNSGKFLAMAQCALYRREFLINNNLYFKKGIYHEDEHWMPRVQIAARCVKYVPLSVYAYEIRPGSITTHGDCLKNGTDLCETCEELYNSYYRKFQGNIRNLASRYNAKLYIRGLCIAIRLKYPIQIRHELIKDNAISFKDKLLFSLFLLFPRFYANVIDLYLFH